MPLIEWRREFETGIPDVDHEHRELVDLINTLHERLGADADHDEVARFLGEVFARISAHFALEETIMRKHRYDEYEAHKADHERLLDEIRDIMDEYEDRAFFDEAQFAERLARWFTEHFSTHDARWHRHLER